MQAMEPVMEEIGQSHCERWATAINHFAYRLGMVLCGDVEAATRCILKLGGWTGELGEPEAQKMVRRHAHLKRTLFQFAMSEEFLKVRSPA